MTRLSGRGASRGSDAPYELLLFVAGDQPNSTLAQRNLAELCKGELGSRCRVEIVDVFENFDAAAEYGVLLTPTLLRVRPEPRVSVIGNLSDAETVLIALQLR